MPKGKKSIDIDDLFDEPIEESTQDRDMVFVNSHAEKPQRPSRHTDRLERLKKAQVVQEGETFGFERAADGEEELDLGRIEISGGEIHKKRNEEILRAREENKRDSQEIMDNLEGEVVEDILSDIDEEIEFLKAEQIEREKRESVHQEIIDEILEDLLK